MKQDYTLTPDGLFAYGYPRAAVTTDQVIFGFDGYQLLVLLVKRGIEPYLDYWALPGGFLRMEETLDECARRVLRSETGLENIYMEQFGVFSDVERDPRWRVVTTAYYALMPNRSVQGGEFEREARWFPISEVPALAFDHDRILRAAMQKLRESLHFRPIGFELLPKQFTIPQLQRLYEAILGVCFDRRNFQKKFLATRILIDLGEKQKNAPHRAGNLYAFDLEQYDQFKRYNSFRLEF